MLALLSFALVILAAPFKSKSRLEAQNAALRHQLIVLRRKPPGRAHVCAEAMGAAQALTGQRLERLTAPKLMKAAFLLLALCDISRRRTNSVANEAKRTFNEERLPNCIYEYAPQRQIVSEPT